MYLKPKEIHYCTHEHKYAKCCYEAHEWKANNTKSYN